MNWQIIQFYGFECPGQGRSQLSFLGCNWPSEAKPAPTTRPKLCAERVLIAGIWGRKPSVGVEVALLSFLDARRALWKCKVCLVMVKKYGKLCLVKTQILMTINYDHCCERFWTCVIVFNKLFYYDRYIIYIYIVYIHIYSLYIYIV